MSSNQAGCAVLRRCHVHPALPANNKHFHQLGITYVPVGKRHRGYGITIAKEMRTSDLTRAHTTWAMLTCGLNYIGTTSFRVTCTTCMVLTHSKSWCTGKTKIDD